MPSQRLYGRLVIVVLSVHAYVHAYISAAQCVCIVSDWGCHGGSLVDLVGHVDLVGYVRVPCRL